MLYAVTARFERPIGGQLSRSAESVADLVYAAKGPESAARKWLWRLTAEERQATLSMTVWAPQNANFRADEVYQGAPLEFARVDGLLTLAEDNAKRERPRPAG